MGSCAKAWCRASILGEAWAGQPGLPPLLQPAASQDAPATAYGQSTPASTIGPGGRGREDRTPGRNKPVVDTFGPGSPTSPAAPASPKPSATRSAVVVAAPFPRRQSHRDRRQRGQARDPPDRPQPQERAVRRRRPGRLPLGRGRLTDRDRQERARPRGRSRQRPQPPRRPTCRQPNRPAHAWAYIPTNPMA
jgi:hypothetical protein